MNNRIILIGGAGYIGCVITQFFLSKGFRVDVIDNLIYSNNSPTYFQFNKNYYFHYLDHSSKKIKKIINHGDNIIILSGLVGDPITKKYPNLSKKINSIGLKKLISNIAGYKLNNLIFVSTCSNYGITNDICNENSELKPISLYAKSKVEIEKLFYEKKIEAKKTILRFSTAFGISPRMRFDLTVNQFTRDLFFQKKIEVYDHDTIRPYCSVKDFAQVIFLILTSDYKYENEIFNVGSNFNNLSKKDICNLIRNKIPNVEIIFSNKSQDKRNYRVSFNKLKKFLNIEPQITVEQGIAEIIDNIQKNMFNEYICSNNLFGNYTLNSS